MAEEGKKKPVGKIIAGVFAVLVVLAVFGGASGSKDYSADSSSSAAEEQTNAEASGSAGATADEAKYVVTDEVLDDSNPYCAYVKGVLTNNSGRDLSYIQVEYVLYDSDDAQIGTALANTNNLKSGGVWKFEAVSLEDADSIARFELADVTAY